MICSLEPDYTPLRRYAHPVSERWRLENQYEDAGVDFFIQIRDDARVHVRILHGHFQVFFAEQKLCDIEYQLAGGPPSRMLDMPVEGGRVSIALFVECGDFRNHEYFNPLFHRGYRWLRRVFSGSDVFCVVPYPEGLDRYLAWYENKRKQHKREQLRVPHMDVEPEWTWMDFGTSFGSPFRNAGPEWLQYFVSDDTHPEWMHPDFMRRWIERPITDDDPEPRWLQRSHWKQRPLASYRSAASPLAFEFSAGQSVEISKELTHNPHLPGVIARIKSYDPGSGLWAVELPSSDWVLLHRNWLKVVG